MEPRIVSPNTPPSQFKEIELQRIDTNIFVANKENLWHPPGGVGVYGGQILGQALASAQQTIQKPSLLVHSLHSYFIRNGDVTNNIIYIVKSIRDGRSFSTRLVTAVQNGVNVFILLASFQIPDLDHISHQWPMPSVPNPEDLPTEAQYYLDIAQDSRCPPLWKPMLIARSQRQSPIDCRPVAVADFLSEFGSPDPAYTESGAMYPKFLSENRNIFWIKCKSKLSDDKNVHTSVLAYASDSWLLGTARGTVAIQRVGMIASLDHSMWFHSEFRADEWLLYVMESPRAHDGRGLSFGYIFTRNGDLAVTVGQEGLIRLRKLKKNTSNL